MSHVDAWTVFRACQPFSTLSQAALQDMFATVTERWYEPGALLMRQGDPADGLLVLLEGSASATLHDTDGAHSVGRFWAGDAVGEIALVTRAPRTADVVAESRVRALQLPVDAFERLAVKHVELCMVLTSLVAERLGYGTRDGLGGKKLDQYRIVRCIGRGGMAVVYEAIDEETGQRVALKMMSHRLVYEPGALARFRQEAAMVQTLQHENIARLDRHFPAYGTCFLVMEFCDGMDLSRLIDARGRLAEGQVRRILGQLATALGHVHGRGLVHRDLKPSNVMVTRTGVVKLMDFGLAIPAAVGDEETRTVGRRIMGTLAFMAPEQMSDLPLDSRADIYGLACIAYDMLTGRHLCDGTNFLDLVQQKLTRPLPRAEEIGDGISDDLHRFLASALRPDRNDRLTSLDALVEWAGPADALPADGASADEGRPRP